jgi:alkylation response protein AidB-like acyl-CoA dehydrogenase
MYTTVARVQLTDANAGMGMMFTGLARAAFELALDYAHERKQGGGTLVQHPGVRARLLEMFRKVEASRALARRAAIFNGTENELALIGAISAKITATQTAFDVANDALQMFGGNGLSREYPVEKILRDARAALIEDGSNEVLAIKGGSMLVQKA